MASPSPACCRRTPYRRWCTTTCTTVPTIRRSCSGSARKKPISPSPCRVARWCARASCACPLNAAACWSPSTISSPTAGRST
ncbi:hypothetical protein EJP617_C060 (plasmid) [Erwinia sp. Ejp617]|nr:hypothetical protein EJP617_C060 [Erwinia sp. Ejp617]